MLAPGRRDAVVEVGARSSQVQLLFISLSGNIIPGLCSLGQELITMQREVKDGLTEPAGRGKDWIF